jgi:hypothetical protein
MPTVRFARRAMNAGSDKRGYPDIRRVAPK